MQPKKNSKTQKSQKLILKKRLINYFKCGYYSKIHKMGVRKN